MMIAAVDNVNIGWVCDGLATNHYLANNSTLRGVATMISIITSTILMIGYLSDTILAFV